MSEPGLLVSLLPTFGYLIYPSPSLSITLLCPSRTRLGMPDVPSYSLLHTRFFSSMGGGLFICCPQKKSPNPTFRMGSPGMEALLTTRLRLIGQLVHVTPLTWQSDPTKNWAFRPLVCIVPHSAGVSFGLLFHRSSGIA